MQANASALAPPSLHALAAPAGSSPLSARLSLRALALGSLLVSSLLGMAGNPAVAATATSATANGQQHVETRIQEMHAKLQITAAQEDLWKAVAQTMRDNQVSIEPLIADREKNAKTATALEDLKSFAEITEAHASGIRKFTAAFEPLYAALSDVQKKDADTLFRNGGNKMAKSK
jgi:hypothetical protein